MPRNGFFSLSGTPIQSISRRTISSSSLALCGPPKMTAPAVLFQRLRAACRRTAAGGCRAGCRGSEAAMADAAGRGKLPCRTIRTGGRIVRIMRIMARGEFMPQNEAIGVPINSYPVDARLQDRAARDRYAARLRAGSAAALALWPGARRAAPAGARAARAAAPARPASLLARPGTTTRLPAHQAAIAGLAPPARPTPPAATAARPRRCRRGPGIRSPPDPGTGR